ncbi:MAG: hypothetical protein NVS1B3_13800 [Candidatus Dormibacteraceae bacterium]
MPTRNGFTVYMPESETMSKVMWVPYRFPAINRQAIAEWFTTESGKDIVRRIQDETGVRYVNTYFAIGRPGNPREPLSEGDWAAYDLWEAPDMASYAKLRTSPAYQEFERRFHPLIVEEEEWRMVFLDPAQ